MKKIKKIILIIILIWVSIFIIDFVCVKTINKPIFMVPIQLKDGGTIEYYGLGYKVIKYNTLGDTRVVFGSLLMDYSPKESDQYKFSNEYPNVPNDNVFAYKNSKETLKILENGSGVIYIGFPECPWCQSYITYIYDAANNNNLDKIYYYNILEDRKNNTDDYKSIVSVLKKYLRYDEEGNKRIYVPCVIVVKNGEILGFDDETSYDTKGYKSPTDYWNNEGTTNLLNKIDEMFKKVSLNTCSECNK